MSYPTELECRRSEWTPGAGVTLGDGGTWYLPVPMFESTPTVSDVIFSYRQTTQRATFGPAFDLAMEGLALATDPADQIQESAFVVADLLRINYDLDPDHLADLLAIHLQDVEGQPPTAESTEMWGAIASAIEPIGWRPKAPLDEQGRRLPCTFSGTRVTLADGQDWFLKPPTLATGERHFDDLDAIQDGDDYPEQLGLLAGLVAVGLRGNYRLTDEEIAGLLSITKDPLGTREVEGIDWGELLIAVSGEPGPERYTRYRYLKLATLIATGNPDLDLSIADATDVAGMLVMAGVIPPSNRWVLREIEAAEDAQTEASINAMVMG